MNSFLVLLAHIAPDAVFFLEMFGKQLMELNATSAAIQGQRCCQLQVEVGAMDCESLANKRKWLWQDQD